MATWVKATPERRAQAYEAWLAQLSAAPWQGDFYQALRRISCAHPGLPPLGEALRPVDEPVRVAQPAEFDFAPAPLHSLERRADAPPRLSQRIFGLVGPNGALPLHLTEYARERAQHHGDRTLLRFLDMLTHRFALLFYRAWAEAQPAVSLDRRGNKAYFDRIGSLTGIGLPSLQNRDALPDSSKVYFAGRSSRQVRDAEGLLAWIRTEFDVPAAIEQWCGHWMVLLQGERSRLGRREGARVGRSAVLGGSVWDVQHKFRITMGPLTLHQYQRFLPGGAELARLHALVRHWVGIEFAWDLKLILAHDEVPAFMLGSLGSVVSAVSADAGVAVHSGVAVEAVGAGVAPDKADTVEAGVATDAPVAPGLAAEGLHDADLVDVRHFTTAFGDRIGLVFRIASGPHAGAELVQSVALKAWPNRALIDLLLGLQGTSTSANRRGVARAPQPLASAGADRGDIDRPEQPGAANADSRIAPAAALAMARELIGRRCRIAVHHPATPSGKPAAALGRRAELGYSTWLGEYLKPQDADDLRIDVERPRAARSASSRPPAGADHSSRPAQGAPS